jgi:hypothetical protein
VSDFDFGGPMDLGHYIALVVFLNVPCYTRNAQRTQGLIRCPRLGDRPRPECTAWLAAERHKREPGVPQGAPRGKKKVTRVSNYFFSGAEEIFAFFFNRVFELPLLRNAQKYDQKKTEQNSRGRGGKKTEEKNPTFFVMSSDGLFRVFELPLLLATKRQKGVLKQKKVDDKKQKK